MTAPVRLQLSRKKGFDLQAHSLAVNGLPAANVARPGPWGNPFIVGHDGTASECVKLYRGLLAWGPCLTCNAGVDRQRGAREYLFAHIDDLRGCNLACWCRAGKPCHADLLLELASEGRPAPGWTARCYDCRRIYGEPGFEDLVVSDDIWSKISPTGDEGGLLCPSCLLARLTAAGLECEGRFTSGPIKNAVREPLAEAREHLTVSGTFQSDKYPTVPAGLVPLSVRDRSAQDLLWDYAARREPVDREFSRDLREALRNAGCQVEGRPAPEGATARAALRKSG